MYIYIYPNPDIRQVAEARGKQSGTISNLDFSADGRYNPYFTELCSGS